MILDKLFNLFVLQFLHCRKGMIILQRVFGRIKWITICGTFRPVSSTFLLGFISDCCCSVVSNSLRPPGLQLTRFPCLSPSPRVCSSSRLLSQWCHPTISFSVILFSSCPQSFPASGSFPMSQFLASAGQSIGVSASASVLPMNIQCWFPLGLTGWISLLSKGLSRVFSKTTVWGHQFFGAQPFLWSSSHIQKTIEYLFQVWIGNCLNSRSYLG